MLILRVESDENARLHVQGIVGRIALVMGLVSTSVTAPALAQTGQSQEEILSGFGDEDKPGEKEKNPPGTTFCPGSGMIPASAEKPKTSGRESVLEGFEDSAAGSEETKAGPASRVGPRLGPLPSWLDLGGSIALSSCLNLDHDAPGRGQIPTTGTSPGSGAN